MGKGTNQIATEAEAKAIGGATASVTTDKCTTKTRATALGCTVSGSYQNNQTVKYSDLSKSVLDPFYTITWKNYSSHNTYIDVLVNGEPIKNSTLSFKKSTSITITFRYYIVNAQTRKVSNWQLQNSSGTVLGTYTSSYTFNITQNVQIYLSSVTYYTSKTITFSIGEGVEVRCKTLNGEFVTKENNNTATSCYEDKVELEITDNLGYQHTTSFSPSIPGASDTGFTMPNSDVTITIETSTIDDTPADGDQYDDIVVLSIPNSVGYRTFTTLIINESAYRTCSNSVSHFDHSRGGLLQETFESASGNLVYEYPEFEGSIEYDPYTIAVSTFYPSFLFKIPRVVDNDEINKLRIIPCCWSSEYGTYSPMVDPNFLNNDMMVTLGNSGTCTIEYPGNNNTNKRSFKCYFDWDFDENYGTLIYYSFSPDLSYNDSGQIECFSIPNRFCIELLKENNETLSRVFVDINYENQGANFNNVIDMSPIDGMSVYTSSDYSSSDLPVTCIYNTGGVPVTTHKLDYRKLGMNMFYEDQGIHFVRPGMLDNIVNIMGNKYSDFTIPNSFSYDTSHKGYAFRVKFPKEKTEPYEIKMRLAIGMLIPVSGSNNKKYVWDYFEHTDFNATDRYGSSDGFINISFWSLTGENSVTVLTDYDMSVGSAPMSIVMHKNSSNIYADILVDLDNFVTVGLFDSQTYGEIMGSSPRLAIYISFTCCSQYWVLCSNPYYELPATNSQITTDCTLINLTQTTNLYSTYVSPQNDTVLDADTNISCDRLLSIHSLQNLRFKTRSFSK